MVIYYNDLEFFLVENIRGIDLFFFFCICKIVYIVVYFFVRGSNVFFFILSI